MNALRRMAARLRGMVRSGHVRSDIAEEFEAHVDMLTEEYRKRGMPEDDARQAARRRFGNVPGLKERGWDVRGSGFAGRIMRDIRYGIRRIRREPAFSAAVVLILGLGIGANTAIFSIVDQVLLRDLPYPEGEELVAVYEAMPARNNLRASVSPANLVDWRSESRTIERFAAWNERTAVLTGDGDPVSLPGQSVSAEFLPVLGVEPILGRVFTTEEDQPGGPPVVILAHALWQQRFGGDPAIVGQSIRLDDVPHTVIGVMPAGFQYLSLFNVRTDFWTPGQVDLDLAWRDMGVRILNVVARIADGSTLEEARNEMALIAERLAGTHEFNEGSTVSLAPVQEEMAGAIRASLWVLYGTVSALLLIASFNVAGLLIARGAKRRGEIALRSSLGASRSTIVGQILIEHLTLALVGGLAGVLVAYWAVTGFERLAPESLLPTSVLAVDGRILAYALGVTLLTGILAGIAPAVSSGYGSLSSHLASSARSIARSRLRESLVVGQVAVTVALLFGSGLLVRSLQELIGGTSGIDSRDVLTFELQLPETRYDGPGRTRFYQQIIDRIENLPGVTSASAERTAPITGGTIGTSFHVEGTPELPPADRPSTRARIATPGYFETLGIPLIAGRTFAADDQRPDAPLVFVVNEVFARDYFSGDNPTDHSISVLMGPENPYGRIVGVVGDVKEGSLREDPQPTVFYDNSHFSFNVPMTVFVRAQRTTGLESAVSSAVHDLDSAVPVNDMAWLDDLLADSVARERLNAAVAGTFSLTALLLVAFGLYALLAFMVAERTREIGIRLALGAGAERVLGLVLRYGLRLAGIGAVIGIAIALSASRLVAGLLYGVSTTDPQTFALTILLLAVVAGVAIVVPARRATGVDPLTALREE